MDHVFIKHGKYYIVETKYHVSASLNLGNPNTGLPRQMNRLFDSVGKDEALFNNIITNGYEGILA
jgi:hypothetical protein